MASDIGNFQKTKNIIWSIILKRDASKENSQGSMFVCCEIIFFRERMLEHDRDEDVLSQMGRSCRTRFHTYRMSEPEYFLFTNKIGGSLSISQETIPNH